MAFIFISMMTTDLVDYNNCLKMMQTVSNQTYLWMKDNYDGTSVVHEAKKMEEDSTAKNLILFSEEKSKQSKSKS